MRPPPRSAQDLKDLRSSLLSELVAVAADVRSRSAVSIAGLISRALSSLSPRPSHPIALIYKALKSELPTEELEAELRTQGYEIAFPVTDGDNLLAVIPAEGATWSKSSIGVLEPPKDARCVPASALSVILVPGVAFGAQGERVGRGRGHYDRFLARAPQALRIAQCLDFQLFESLPQQPHDQRVHWIFTPTLEIKRPSS